MLGLRTPHGVAGLAAGSAGVFKLRRRDAKRFRGLLSRLRGTGRQMGLRLGDLGYMDPLSIGTYPLVRLWNQPLSIWLEEV